MSELKVYESPIKGLFVVELVVHGDNRGWFKENYQREKMEALGLPHFEVVQNNISYNAERGVTRGMHAEPWEKFISVANGCVFGAWADLRPSPDFGKTFTITVTPEIAIFTPRGVANGYQTLEPNTVYTYLVNGFWSKEAKYTFVNIRDKQLDIHWPIEPRDELLSEKDINHPTLAELRKTMDE